ncbi:MAG: hypothetical protein NZ601_01360 [candidate division WOR-3 bacterium]|nr:hypothetical protein [candidate division WOR-3 bacterium]MCX7757951.1 hypothetical protein [candidate division WOR-3 bacterium]MDW7987298.1 hypothetical protein [candidate division WOR-3 bacterium]
MQNLKFVLIVCSVVNLLSAGELLTNGNFEQPLDIGWYSTIVTATSYDTIDRQTFFHPDPDYEVRVKKYDAVCAKVYQTISIPTTDLDFSVNAKLYAYEYTPTASYWAAAAIILRYLDDNNNWLGETRITYKTPHSPWINTSTVHLINAPDPNNWYQYNFNLNSELANLSGINSSAIRKIQVLLMDTTNGC